MSAIAAIAVKTRRMRREREADIMALLQIIASAWDLRFPQAGPAVERFIGYSVEHQLLTVQPP